MKKILLTIFIFLLFSKITSANIADELTKLNNLYKEGAITKEEFSKAKEILFKSNSDEKDQPKKVEKQEKKNKPIKVKKFDQDLSKTFISLDEIDEIGTYKKLSNYPKDLFNKTNMSSKALASKAAQEMYKTFVQNKNQMEKYPENMMKGMGYFEVFYLQKLKEGEKYIEKFKKDYPNISSKTKKEIRSLYSLNQARKSMRESIGLTLNDDTEEALERYMHMYNFLSKGEKIKQNLTKNQKKLLEMVNYKTNNIVIHSDEKIMPNKLRNWSSWNYRYQSKNLILTYWMNLLQNLKLKKNIFVTLNYDKINKEKIIKKLSYRHPVFKYDKEELKKQNDITSGENHIYFAGAWLGYGFHEDGVKSAIEVFKKLDVEK